MRWQVAAALASIFAALAAALALSTPPATGGAKGPAGRVATAPASHLATSPAARVATTVVRVPAPGLAPSALSTEVWYPAASKSGRLVPDRAGAPYPLVVFSQGFAVAVSSYSGLLREWAANGFVVAAPTYPYTAPPGPLYEADIINHPAELRLVLSALTGLARQHTSPLAGLVNAAEVGLAGHSDGGDVSLAVAYNTCCRDPLVKAVAVLSGAELSSFGGRYFAGTGHQVPLLVVQGSADTVNPPACSAQIYDEAQAPKYYLDLLGARHYAPYIERGPKGPAQARLDASYRDIVAKVTTDFFEAELKGRPGALGALAQAGQVPGVAELFKGGQAPPTTGWCPGSPA